MKRRGAWGTLRTVVASVLAASLSVGMVLIDSPAEAQSHSHASGSRSHSSASRHRTRARQRVNMRAYRSAMRGWHDVSNLPPVTTTPDGRMVLRLYSVNTHARAELTPLRADGGFDEQASNEFARVLGDPRSHETHAIDPRLMDLVYRAAAHFRARQITVISGYRAGAGHSNHARGMAVDFLIPGVSDRALSAFAQTFTNVGVGNYPASGFVHLDVRDYNTTWTDYSGPGQRARYARRHQRHHRHRHRS